MSDDLNVTIGLADHQGTRVTVSYDPADEEAGGLISLTVALGMFSAYSSPTPSAARQVAGALLDAADRADADNAERSA